MTRLLKILRILIWSLLLVFIFSSIRQYQFEIERYYRSAFYYSNGYEELARDCRILTCLINKIEKPIKRDAFMRLYIDCFNTSQKEVQIQIDTSTYYKNTAINTIEEHNLRFYFDTDGYLEKIYRGELEIVDYTHEPKFIPPPTLSFIQGYDIYSKEFLGTEKLIYTVIPILMMMIIALIYYFYYELKSKKLSHLTYSIIIQFLSLFMITIFIFLFNYYTNLMMKSEFSEPDIFNIENLASAFQRIMIYPAVLFDILVVNVLIFIYLSFRGYRKIRAELKGSV